MTSATSTPLIAAMAGKRSQYDQRLRAGEVAPIVDGAGEDLLRGLPGGIPPLAELIKRASALATFVADAQLLWL